MQLRNTFLVLLLPLLIYLPSIRSDFVALDDELLILDNPAVHGLTWKNIQKAFLSYDPELYIPLTLLTYQIDYEIWGLNPIGFHLTNLILHLGSTVVLLYTFRKLLDEKTALVAALLFGIHPLNTEAVMWASARKDVLMGFFFLLSLNFYLRSSDSKIAALRLSNHSYEIIAFILACLSKVTAVTLPFLLLGIDYLQHKPLNRANFQRKTPYFLLSLLFILIAIFGKHAQTSLRIPVLISFVSIPFSLGKFFYPTNLSIFYPFTDQVIWTHPSVLVGAFLFITITIACWLIRKRSSLPLISWTIFLILLAPSLTNVLKGGGYDAFDIYITSDRYMYLPILALLPLTAYILTRKPFIYGAPIVILLLSYTTFAQARTWRNSETLFAQATISQKNVHVAFTNLAGIYAENGDLERALQLYENAKAIKPTWRTLFNLGQIYASLGRYANAIDAYEELLLIRPDYAEALAQLGGLLLQTGNIQEALVYLERARMFDPNITSVHYNLGLIYEHGNNPSKAREEFQQVLELNPSDVQAKRKLGQ